MDNLYTIKQLSEAQRILSVPAIRDKIFKCKENGLHETGAIMRMGRKILIDKDKFEKWFMESLK